MAWNRHVFNSQHVLALHCCCCSKIIWNNKWVIFSFFTFFFFFDLLLHFYWSIMWVCFFFSNSIKSTWKCHLNCFSGQQKSFFPLLWGLWTSYSVGQLVLFSCCVSAKFFEQVICSHFLITLKKIISEKWIKCIWRPS